MRLFSFFILLCLSLTAQAAPVFSSGDIKFTGDSYISTLLPDETIGIGRVSTITQGDEVLWTSGTDGNFINFVFGGFTPVVSPTSPIFNFQSTGGYVDFYLNTAGVFDTATGVNTAITSISSGSLLLSTVANGPTVGIATNVSYSANGFLDVTGGLFNWLLDSNTRPVFDPIGFADLSFGLVGSNNSSKLVSKDYQYIASSDLQGSISQVPLPSAIWFMGIGLVTLLGFRRHN